MEFILTGTRPPIGAMGRKGLLSVAGSFAEPGPPEDHPENFESVL